MEISLKISLQCVAYTVQAAHLPSLEDNYIPKEDEYERTAYE